MRLSDLLLGKPLPTELAPRERVGVLRGIPLLGLDALSSAAYGPEALLTVLLPLGAGALRYVLPLTVGIGALLVIVFLSYRQTIEAYPSGGGSYTVAKENLGRSASLVAAAALGLDYVLNVAVAISAGVGAVVSALPQLLPDTVPICLLVLLAIVLVNLRGVAASGTVFALPTYLFVASLLAIIGVGLVHAAAHAPRAVASAPAPMAASVVTATPWLLMRAFANGCTAMTGVEAVSNAVPNFRPPSTVRARRTLGAIVFLLAIFIVGIAILCRAYHVVATPPGEAGYESILSQLAHIVLGRGVVYGICMASIFTVLALSANTSFADFPRVARLLAADGFLPEPFEHRGRRLVFSHGIFVLAAISGLLIVVFGGITDRLIPLFAFGALLAFTMSQSGMVVHWRKAHDHGPRLWLNAAGALATGLTVVLVLVSKFTEGAWISVLVVLGLIAVFTAVRRHHDFIERATRSDAPLGDARPRPPLAVVPLRGWSAVALNGLRFALGLTPDVVVVQVLTDDTVDRDLTPRWHDLAETPAARWGVPAPRLVVLRSEYRQLYFPLLRFVNELSRLHPDRHVAVVVPELVETRWYHAFLRSHVSTMIKTLLLYRGDSRVAVVSTPFHVTGGQE